MKKGMSLIVLIVAIIVIIILSSVIVLGIISNSSVIELAEEARAISDFLNIKSEVILYANIKLIEKTQYTNISELLPIELNENGEPIIMDSLNNMLLYSEIKILQGLSGEVDLNRVYKLKLNTSNNAYAVVDKENKTFDIILASGVKIRNNIVYSSNMLNAIIKVSKTESLQEYKQIIDRMSPDKILANISVNGGFEKGTNEWKFYDSTENYSSIQDSYQISGKNSINIDCYNPQNKEYSIYKDLVGGNNGDTLYMAASIYIPEPTQNIYTLRKANYASWNSQNNVRYNNNIIGDWQRKSMTRPISSDDTGARLYIGIVENKEVQAPINIYIDDVVVVNLTQIFGSNIPTQEQCDILFSKYYEGNIGKPYLYYTVANQ